MKKIIKITIVTTIFIVPMVALQAQGVRAEERGEDHRGRPAMMELRDDAREDMREIRRESKDMRKDRLLDGREDMKMATSAEARMKARADMKADMKLNMEQRKAQVEVRKIELKKQIEAKKVENKQLKAKKLDERNKQKVGEKLGKVYARLSERLMGLTRVDAELTMRLNRMATSGVDVAPIRGLQATAQIALAKAKVDVEATKTLAAAEVNSTTTKETLRALVKTAEDSLKAAARAYKTAIDAAKILPKPVAQVQVEAQANVNNQ